MEFKKEDFLNALRKIEAFQEISATLKVHPTEEEFSKAIVAVVTNAIGVVACGFVVLSEQGYLERLAAIGSDVNEDSFVRIEEQLSRQAINRRSTVTRKVTFKGRKKPVYYLAEPIYHRERENPFGTLFVESLHLLTEGDRKFLASVTSQIGIAIANSRLAEKMKLETTEFLSLVEIGTAISSELDVEKLLSLVTHTAAQLVRAENASLILVDRNSGKLVKEAAYGLVGEFSDKKVSKSEGITAGWIVKSGFPLLVSDARGDSRFKSLTRGRRKVKSLISVPLKLKDKTIGVLNVENIDSGHQFITEDLDLLIILAGQAATAISNAYLYTEMRELYVNTIKSLIFAAEVKDKYQKGHSDKVTQNAVILAKEMGLSDEEVENVRYAGNLHDIGKIGVPEAILLKPGPLTQAERRIVEEHPRASAKILRPIRFLRGAVPIVWHHHERYDGTGYTDELAGEDIPVGARILAVADAYEAMTSDRPYRGAMSKEEAVEELKRGAGTQFDPSVVKIFVSLLTVGKVK